MTASRERRTLATLPIFSIVLMKEKIGLLHISSSSFITSSHPSLTSSQKPSGMTRENQFLWLSTKPASLPSLQYNSTNIRVRSTSSLLGQADPILVIETHPETPPSLRIDKAFPALLEYANAIDFAKLDVTDHGHIPFVIILVRVLEDWKTSVSYCRKTHLISAEFTRYSIVENSQPRMLRSRNLKPLSRR